MISPFAAELQGDGVGVVSIGRRKVPVSSLKEAVATWEQYRDANGLGASESPLVRVCLQGEFYRISYNGRVWRAGDGLEVVL